MLDNTQKALIALIDKALFGADITLPDGVDPSAIYCESVAHAVTALAYDAIPEGTIPPDVDAAWKNAVNSVYRRNIRVEAEHAELHRLLTGGRSQEAPSPACGEGGPFPHEPQETSVRRGPLSDPLSPEATEGRGNGLPRRSAPRNDSDIQSLTLQSGDSIPYVILKGCASAEYYHDPFLRTLGDVDFLIRPEDADRADRLLRDKGFAFKPSSNTDERVYVRGKSVWELHTAANGTPGGEIGKRIRALMSDAIEESTAPQAPSPARAKRGFSPAQPDLAEPAARFSPTGREDLALAPSPASQSGASFLVPSEFHHGLILLLHTARHMTTGGVGLRQICDWAVFVAHMGERFPETFEEKLRSVGLWKFACVLTQLSSEYLGAPTQKWAGEPDRGLLKALMDDIFAGGNFGTKDKSRRDQAKFITDRKSGGSASRSTAGQAVRSANEIVRRHWPIAAKLPILYPAGWLFFGGRYAVRAALGKRKKLDLSGIAKGAKFRREIYEKLNLFLVK